MKKKWIRGTKSLLLSGIVFVLLLSGCATLGAPRDQEVLEVLALISAGDAAILTEATRKPFLLDGEILEGESAVALLWQGLSDAGFAFHNPVIRDIQPVSPEQYHLFASTMEAEVFFKKYLTKKDSLIFFHADEGEFVLVLGPRKDGRQMAAWGGVR